MKILKFIGLGILGLVVILVIVTLVAPTDFGYEKSITINAPIEVVWENVGSLEAMDKWSPWAAKDPNRILEMSGIDGTVGAVQSWESEVEEVGVGSLTITKVEAPTSFETDLKFIKPYESEAIGYVRLSKKGEGTEVLWGFASDLPRPVNLMMVFMDMDAQMDAEFGSGLDMLKKLCEN